MAGNKELDVQWYELSTVLQEEKLYVIYIFDSMYWFSMHYFI